MLSLSFPSNDYLWPTSASKTLTTVFGDIRPFRYHTGIDIRTYGINGHEVYAIQNGHISRIVVSTSGYGKAIYIKINGTIERESNKNYDSKIVFSSPD